MPKRIMFTGGTGKAGRHVVKYLVDNGYDVLNLDLKPLDNPNVRTLITDITDSGQVYTALSSYDGDCTNSIRCFGRSRSTPSFTSPPIRAS